jgi:hypothetical protein
VIRGGEWEEGADVKHDLKASERGVSPPHQREYAIEPKLYVKDDGKKRWVARYTEWEPETPDESRPPRYLFHVRRSTRCPEDRHTKKTRQKPTTGTGQRDGGAPRNARNSARAGDTWEHAYRSSSLRCPLLWQRIPMRARQVSFYVSILVPLGRTGAHRTCTRWV